MPRVEYNARQLMANRFIPPREMHLAKGHNIWVMAEVHNEV